MLSGPGMRLTKDVGKKWQGTDHFMQSMPSTFFELS